MRSGEHVNGAKKARDIHRVPIDGRWDGALFNAVRGAPWEMMGQIQDEPRVLQAPAPPPENSREPVEQKPPAARKIKLTKEVLNRHGYTAGCQVCTFIREGWGYRPHTDACRARLAESFKSDERMAAQSTRAEERLNQWLAETGLQERTVHP